MNIHNNILSQFQHTYSKCSTISITIFCRELDPSKGAQENSYKAKFSENCSMFATQYKARGGEMPVLASQVFFRLKAARACEETSVGTNADLPPRGKLVSFTESDGTGESQPEDILRRNEIFHCAAR